MDTKQEILDYLKDMADFYEKEYLSYKNDNDPKYINASTTALTKSVIHKDLIKVVEADQVDEMQLKVAKDDLAKLIAERKEELEFAIKKLNEGHLGAFQEYFGNRKKVEEECLGSLIKLQEYLESKGGTR